MTFKNMTDAQKQTGFSYLLGLNSSAKLLKNMTVSNQLTGILYLAPASLSGYNVCSHSTLECRAGCLSTSGRAGIGTDNIIQKARISKTKLFYEERDFFMSWMIAEIKNYEALAIKNGYGFSIRLNGTSDIDWANIKFNGQNVFDMFPHIQFYDYTKNPNKFINKPVNYHLTFSYSGNNWTTCESLLNKGFNVATIFNITKKDSFPPNFKTYSVVDGDLTDYRPSDGVGVIVGLRWKRISDRYLNSQIKKSIFVIQ